MTFVGLGRLVSASIGRASIPPRCSPASIRLGVVALCVGAALLSCRLEATTVGLVNPSFEDWNGDVAGWFVDSKAKAQGTMAADSANAQHGQYALKLSPNTTNTPGKDPLGVGQVVPAASYRGMEAVITAWLGADGGATAVVGLSVLNTRGASIDGIQLRQSSPSNGLQEHRARLAIPAGDSAEHIVLFCAAEGTQGSGYFDNISLTVEPVSGPSSEPVTGQSASIVIYPEDVVRQIPETLFGTNVEWMHNGNEIWNPTTNSARPEFVTMTRDLDLSLIRFPGGGLSDVYNWRDGVGDPATRPTTPHYPGGPSSQHTFGTDEALEFAGSVGANLLITVNAGTGTAQEAADWVEYVNGPNGQSPRGERVVYWEIGNELYMKEDFSGATMPPATYAAKAQDFVNAMRAVDPTIKLGAIGGLNYGRYQVVDYPNWNETVLSALGSEIDYLAVHNAYAPVIVEGSGVSPERAYRAMLAAPLLIAQNLRDIANQIQTHAPDRADEISIAITEWGPLFHILPSSEWVDHPKTLGGALFVADTMRVFMHAPKVEVATFFKLTEPGFLGWIGPKGTQNIPKAPYMAFRMYRDHFASTLVRAEAKSPTYDSQGTGMVDAVRGVPYLTVCASVNPDTRTVYAMVVNKHLTQPIEAEISIEGLQSVSSGTQRVLTGGSPDAHTGTTLPTIAGIEWAQQRSFSDQMPFDSAQLETITLTESALNSVGTEFTHVFPPRSVTNLELRYDP